MRQRFSWMILFAVAAATASAQTWVSAYDKAIGHARKSEWVDARAAFKQAAANRTEDYAKATNLPGPATERRLWRNGAPYSPNFLAAYSAYKAGMSDTDQANKKRLLDEAAVELESLIAKNQLSYEAFYFLNDIYSNQGDNAKRMRLDEQFSQASGQLTWKVDTDILMPEEIAVIAQMAGRDISQPGTGVPPTDPNTNVSNPPMLSGGGTRVPVIGNKYALIIGNTETKLPSLAVPFASDDAQLIRDSLIANAGYGEANIDLVLNATAAQIMNSAKALADRIPNDATVLIYFTGVGANIDGKDYLAGVDTESATDSASMASKMAIMRLFLAKGAFIFSFFQAHRPITNGRYFGMEVPLGGSIAQMQSTIPGERILSFTRNGKERGIYTDAFTGTLNEIRNNRIQIQDFGWRVFYNIRRGGTGSKSGGSPQTPTLPVLTNMASDAQF